MKTYKFIVINKSNMTQISHFSSAERAADKIFNFSKVFNPSNWLIIKDESRIVKLPISGGDQMSIYRSVVNCLTY